MPTVRVKIDDSTWETMKRYAPVALQDPEIIRQYISLGLVYMGIRNRVIEQMELDVDILDEVQDEHEDEAPDETDEE
jgi:hypothetical protein